MNFDVFYYINGTSAFYCGKNLFRINILSQCSRKFYKGGPLDEKKPPFGCGNSKIGQKLIRIPPSYTLF